MRALILGADGMLGHKALQVLRDRFNTFATFRDRPGLWTSHPAFACLNLTYTPGGVNAFDLDSMALVADKLDQSVLKPKIIGI